MGTIRAPPSSATPRPTCTRTTDRVRWCVSSIRPTSWSAGTTTARPATVPSGPSQSWCRDSAGLSAARNRRPPPDDNCCSGGSQQDISTVGHQHSRTSRKVMSTMSSGKMQAIQVRGTGGPEVLEYVEIDVPEPGSGEVAIQVGAAGVNFIDIYHRQGIYPMPLPFVPGREGAGRVIAVGADVSGVAIGDRVAWLQVPGSYAEVVVGPAEKLIPVPDGLSDEQAAALALQGLTVQSLATDVYRIEAGDTVLIHAGAGGVGLLLTQVAKVKGARVITTVSTAEKAALSRAAGADEVLIGYDGFPSAVRDFTGGVGVDAAYDGVGKATFDGSLDALRVRGN